MNPRTLSTPPSLEPVNVADLRDHLALDTIDDDPRLAIAITAARRWVENETERALIAQTWKLYLDAWPAEIVLPRPPLASVTSITYVDGAGDTQTLDSSAYEADTDAVPGIVRPVYGGSWPTARDHPKAICVTYVAGYGSKPTDVPEELRQAIRLLAADLYEFREVHAEGSLKRLPHIRWMVSPYIVPEAS